MLYYIILYIFLILPCLGPGFSFGPKLRMLVSFSPNSGPEPSFGVENGPNRCFRPELKPGPKLGAKIKEIYNI